MPHFYDHSPTRPTRVLVLVVATAGLAVAAGSVSLSQSADAETPSAQSAESSRLVHGTSFEQSNRQWRSQPGTKLGTSSTARFGKRAARLSRSKAGPAILNDVPNSLTGVPKGLRVKASVWVRSSQVRQVAVLKVYERTNGTKHLIRKKRVVLQRNRWTRIRAQGITKRQQTSIDVRIRANRLKRGNAFLIDNIRMHAVRAPTARRLSNGCSLSPRGIPGCGVLLGGTYGSNSDPSTWEGRMRKKLGVRRTFWRPDQIASAVKVARGDLARGRLPWISFKLPYTWKRMAKGDGNAWARNIATRLARLNGPVWVAFHHEPETDGDITQWTRLQEQLAPVVRKTAPNVAYTIVLTGWHNLYGEKQYSLNSLWPDTKIDVAGFDVYNFYGWKNTEKMQIKKDYFNPIAAWAKNRGVHWGLAETGFSDPAAKADPQWILRTYNQMTHAGGVAMSYFNTHLNNPSGVNWQLDNKQKQQAFEQAMERAPTM